MKLKFYLPVVLCLAGGYTALKFAFMAKEHVQTISQPTSSLSVYDRNGLSMGNLLSPDENYSMPVSLESISPWLILATIATEDKRFYFHSGVDLQATLRALWQNVTHGRVVSGASTLTEQLVRSLDPYPKTLWGKWREAWGAISLEKKL